MRVEPHSVGSVLHVVKRGGRGTDIVRNEHDRFNFTRSLFILNDAHQDNNWRDYTSGKPLFYRPETWPERKPLVSILAWTLLDNHFHLLLQEIEEGGIAKFMQRLGGSLTLHNNERYGERGSIFQGGYKGRLVETDKYLQYLQAYIVVKNTFEMYPGGLKKALAQFEDAWKFASTYQFTSFLTAATGAPSPLLDMQTIDSLGLTRDDFKRYARSMLAVHARTKDIDENVVALLLEEW